MIGFPGWNLSGNIRRNPAWNLVILCISFHQARFLSVVCRYLGLSVVPRRAIWEFNSTRCCRALTSIVPLPLWLKFSPFCRNNKAQVHTGKLTWRQSQQSDSWAWQLRLFAALFDIKISTITHADVYELFLPVNFSFWEISDHSHINMICVVVVLNGQLPWSDFMNLSTRRSIPSLLWSVF